ncbi:hypothetical protein PR048_033696 [Dryococelus australis]|uniref:Uncharacterized protein n=1 Tax=Dryococelus australis TaxID=614101 RepID=A0ABQ9G403_9NEOP|nr:hypothetical protein PR048_033696 [Dryococelus australis]
MYTSKTFAYVDELQNKRSSALNTDEHVNLILRMKQVKTKTITKSALMIMTMKTMIIPSTFPQRVSFNKWREEDRSVRQLYERLKERSRVTWRKEIGQPWPLFWATTASLAVPTADTIAKGGGGDRQRRRKNPPDRKEQQLNAGPPCFSSSASLFRVDIRVSASSNSSARHPGPTSCGSESAGPGVKADIGVLPRSDAFQSIHHEPAVGSPQNPAVRIATLHRVVPRDWATSSRRASPSRTELPSHPRAWGSPIHHLGARQVADGRRTQAAMVPSYSQKYLAFVGPKRRAERASSHEHDVHPTTTQPVAEGHGSSVTGFQYGRRTTLMREHDVVRALASSMCNVGSNELEDQDTCCAMSASPWYQECHARMRVTNEELPGSSQSRTWSMPEPRGHPINSALDFETKYSLLTQPRRERHDSQQPMKYTIDRREPDRFCRPTSNFRLEKISTLRRVVRHDAQNSMSRQSQCSRVLQAPSCTVGFTCRYHSLLSIQARNTSLAVVPQSPVVHTTLRSRTLGQIASGRGASQSHQNILASSLNVSETLAGERRSVTPASLAPVGSHGIPRREADSHEYIVPGRGEGEVGLQLRLGAAESAPAAALPPVEVLLLGQFSASRKQSLTEYRELQQRDDDALHSGLCSCASKVKRERYGRQFHARLVPHRSYVQAVQCFCRDAVLCKLDMGMLFPTTRACSTPKMRRIKTPVYLELFPAFDAERRGSANGDTATRLLPWKHIFITTSEVSVEQRRKARAGQTGDPRENTQTSGIVLHDSQLRKSGVTRPGIETGSPSWEASSLTAQPPRSHTRFLNGNFRTTPPPTTQRYSTRLKSRRTEQQDVAKQAEEGYKLWRSAAKMPSGQPAVPRATVSEATVPRPCHGLQFSRVVNLKASHSTRAATHEDPDRTSLVSATHQGQLLRCPWASERCGRNTEGRRPGSNLIKAVVSQSVRAGDTRQIKAIKPTPGAIPPPSPP